MEKPGQVDKQSEAELSVQEFAWHCSGHDPSFQ